MNRLAVLGLGVLAGCTSSFMFGRIAPEASPPSAEESVVVLGVAPQGYAVNIFPGKVEGGVFRVSGFSGAVISGPPKDGYVVARAMAGQALALTKSTRLAQQGEVLSHTFGACDGTQAMAFTVPRGKVIYLTDIEYTVGSGRLDAYYRPDLARARQYLDKAYPKLAGRLEQGDYRFIPTNEPCKRR